MGSGSPKTEIERLRDARIRENHARMAELGLLITLEDPRSITSSSKSKRRKRQKIDYSATPLRRSSRLEEKNKRKTRLFRLQEGSDDGSEKNLANESPLRLVQVHKPFTRRYKSKGRRSPTYGNYCHLCRHKILCEKEDCGRCRNLDLDGPCLGKTNCSVCHSKAGIFCQPCLNIRYGEEFEDFKANENWICPHCIEQKESKPYWICNSSLCLKRRGIEPLGRVISKVRKMGYKFVAHYISDELQKADKATI